MKHYLLMILFILAMPIGNLYAQSKGVCGNKFEEINKKCIRSNYIGVLTEKEAALAKDKKDRTGNETRFKRTLIVIKKPYDKLEGNSYFFKTATGRVGKFIIRSATKYGSSTESRCEVNLDIVTYFPNRVETPTGAFSIETKFGRWTTDKAGFDSKSTEDLILKDIKGNCVLTTGTSTAVFYKKILKDRLIKGRDLLAQAGLFLVFLSVFLVARAVFQDEDRYKAQSMLEEAEKEEKEDFNSDIILKYSRPFFKRYFTPVVQGMKNKKKIREKYKRKLATAGMTKVLTPEDMFAFKLFLIIGFPILFLALRQFLEESWPLTIVPIISVIGFKYPDIWLNGKISQRKEEVVNAMPFIVDMLALAVEAGLDFMAAITKVIEKAPPTALSEEFEILVKETKVGASRAEGLRQLAWRTDSIEISSFTATLIAADSVGASIGPILKTLAAEMRQKRSAEAEKKGATAATKILFPMMFLIMPAVAIIIMAPIGLQLMGA